MNFTRWAGYFQLKNRPYFTCICIKFGIFSTSFRSTEKKIYMLKNWMFFFYVAWIILISISISQKHRLTHAHSYTYARTHARTQTLAYECVEIWFWFWIFGLWWLLLLVLLLAQLPLFFFLVLVSYFFVSYSDFITGNRWQSSTIINFNIKKSAIQASQ